VAEAKAEFDVVICEDVFGPPVDELSRKFAVLADAELWRRADELREYLRGARALIVRNRTQVTRELLEGAPRLVVVGRAGAGLDNVDVGAASELGVVVCYAPVQNARSVAEHVMGLLLALVRKIPQADQSVREGKWLRHEHTGHELFGKTMGIVGLGRIGSLVASLAKAFGMKIIAHDPYVSTESAQVKEIGCELVELDELLARADVITIHVPLSEDTFHLIDRAALAKMKRTAVLINASRGPVVDEEALYEALSAGEIAGAALDVRESEPPAPGSPLHRMANVVLTPHIAAFTHEAQAAVVRDVVADVEAVLTGRPAKYPANFPTPRK